VVSRRRRTGAERARQQDSSIAQRPEGHKGHAREGRHNFCQGIFQQGEGFCCRRGPHNGPTHDNAYIGGAASNVVSKPRLMAAAAAQAKACTNEVLVSGRVAATRPTKPEDPWEVSGAVPARNEPKNRTHRLPSDRTHRLPTKAARGLGLPGDVRAPTGFSMAPGGMRRAGMTTSPSSSPMAWPTSG
jgi:hypothetical protein